MRTTNHPSPERDVMELDELERLAKAATPGPWRWGRDIPPEEFELCDGMDECDLYGAIVPNNPALVASGDPPMHRPRIIITDSGHYPPEENDAAFIAAANPTTVLALIARIRELETASPGIANRGAPTPPQVGAAMSDAMKLAREIVDYVEACFAADTPINRFDDGHINLANALIAQHAEIERLKAGLREACDRWSDAEQLANHLGHGHASSRIADRIAALRKLAGE